MEIEAGVRLDDLMNDFRRIMSETEEISGMIHSAFRDFELDSFTWVFRDIMGKAEECYLDLAAMAGQV